MMGHCESMKVVSNNDNQLTMHHQLEIVNQVKMKRANFTSINKEGNCFEQRTQNQLENDAIDNMQKQCVNRLTKVVKT